MHSRRRFYFSLGLAFIFLGFLFLLGAFQGITGFTISSINSPLFIEGYLAMIFIMMGALILIHSINPNLEGIASSQEKTASDIKSIDDIVDKVVGKGEGEQEILIDADFLTQLKMTYSGEDGRINFPTGLFGKYRPLITNKVEAEATRKNTKNLRLIHPNMMTFLKKNYLNQRLYSPTQEEIKIISDLWITTPKGKGEPSELSRFKDSGDLQMLAYAIHRGQKSTVILTNNYSEIGKIAEKLRQEYGINIHVLTGKDFGLVPPKGRSY